MVAHIILNYFFPLVPSCHPAMAVCFSETSRNFQTNTHLPSPTITDWWVVTRTEPFTTRDPWALLYVSTDLGSSFHLKKNSTKKCFSYGKLLSENNFAILSFWLAVDNFLSSRCQIRRGYVTAELMYVCVSRNTRDSPPWKLSKLSSWESTNVFEKEKTIVSLFFVKAKEKEMKDMI